MRRPTPPRAIYTSAGAREHEVRGGAVARPRGGAPVRLRVTAALWMWRASWAMKPKAEKCFSPLLKYPEVQDYQVAVSWSSSQWNFSREGGGRTITRGAPFDPDEPLKRSLPPARQASSGTYHTNEKVNTSPFTTSRQPS
jgi:hypothetical protein